MPGDFQVKLLPMDEPIGVIAGQGRLPLITAQGIRAAGRKVACVGLADQYDAELPSLCDYFARAGIIRISRWTRLLRRWGVREVVLIGRVHKARMYQPLRFLRQMPDWRAAQIWYRALRHDKRSATLLGAVADELARHGITVIDSTRYIPDHLAPVGVLTRRGATSEMRADIEFGWPLVKQLNELDIGQSIAVRDREVVAVEAIEGTDRMIERAGALCRMGRWTLIKTAKPDHDMRLDVPTVGPTTIENLKRAGAACLALEAGRVIMADKQRMVERADELGIVVVGLTKPQDISSLA